ncbi:DUF2149 domain-containing protein [Sediminicurvatus halobius]|uniref:DUF2149 domain-containing protein n=1 Tax=Sediminicurvatus halobius TaxID=2182432 RepID=A0A2U2N2E1_9GAMM|nr:DUF2149 domain-containing protein [Spiribacter halobius]PWG63144.1 hypothetical protein DEM34_09860 [Spiribacter halobius]UEX77593.1 DUF2149 domain-containing protein [Spiribacter halobius]
MKRLTQTRFDTQETDPMGPLANLTDIMLVFICGLLVALAARSDDLREVLTGREVVERGEELAEPPAGVYGEGGAGMEPVGRVYRDPETGRLIMVGEDDG